MMNADHPKDAVVFAACEHVLPNVLASALHTGSLISIVPLIVAFLYLQRFWQSGLATGGVKG